MARVTKSTHKSHSKHMVKAPEDEIAKIRTEKERDYLLYNGRLLYEEYGKYVYLFRMEDQIMTPGDTPAELKTKRNKYRVKILRIERFDIYLSLDEEISERELSQSRLYIDLSFILGALKSLKEIKNMMDYLLNVLTIGDDFNKDDSETVIILETLLNQRIGLEKATAGTLAIHYYFNKDKLQLSGRICDVLKKYPDYEIPPKRRAAKYLLNRLKREIPCLRIRIEELNIGQVGFLASLQRYFDRSNSFIFKLLKSTITSEQLKQLTPEDFIKITGLNFPMKNLPGQLSSAAKVIEMRETKKAVTKKELKKLPRIGEEAATTLLVYIFQEAELIVDEYLQRILYRHRITPKLNASKSVIENKIGSFVKTHKDADRLHARINCIGMGWCKKQKPECDSCPLKNYL